MSCTYHTHRRTNARSSFSFRSLRRQCSTNELLSCRNAQATTWLKRPPLGSVVRFEEVFDFIKYSGTQLGQGMHGRRIHLGGGNTDEPIVADCLATLCLRSLEHADQLDFEKGSNWDPLVHNHKHIDCIPVFGSGPRDETEIPGENCADRQDTTQAKAAQVRVELILVAAALWRVDDDMY